MTYRPRGYHQLTFICTWVFSWISVVSLLVRLWAALGLSPNTNNKTTTTTTTTTSTTTNHNTNNHDDALIAYTWNDTSGFLWLSQIVLIDWWRAENRLYIYIYMYIYIYLYMYMYIYIYMYLSVWTTIDRAQADFPQKVFSQQESVQVQMACPKAR